MNYKNPKEKIDEIATKAGYACIKYQKDIGMVSYTKVGVRINIYLTTMTVGTCLIHPNKGPTQLFRKNVSLKELKDIFYYPRKHTGKGYYKKQ